MPELRLAVIGDIHGCFDEDDVRALNASRYDAVLFVGDLPTHRLGKVYEIAARIAGVAKPAYLIPGNHDGTTLAQLAHEVFGVPPHIPGAGRRQLARVERMRRRLGAVKLCGYDWHQLGEGIGLVCARPHAMGGGLSFAPYLARAFGVRDLAESGERLKRVIDACPCERLIVLAHNGPTGLGDRAADIWGCDFRPEAGDWGDPDLREMLEYAQAKGRRVLAVVAGHMHLRTKTREDRTWHVVGDDDGVHYVNAARVPRVFRKRGAWARHHVALEIDGTACRVEEVSEWD